ncbi:MAG: hypothetical protein PIR02_15255 [Microbacterium enclense]
MRISPKLLIPVVVAAATLAPSLPASAAVDPSSPPVSSDGQQQAQEAVDAWKANKPSSSVDAAPPKVDGSATAAGSWTTRTSLYRGSWLMWANEHVDFASDNSRVLWSSGFQESGAVFPNNVTQNGTSRVSNEGWKHVWRGSYTVGAGAPTPWGNVNVYNASSTATTAVWAGNGSSGSWSD